MFHRGCINRVEIADYLRPCVPLFRGMERDRTARGDFVTALRGGGKTSPVLCVDTSASLSLNKKCAFNLGDCWNDS